MSNMLLEKYSKKLQLSESVYGKSHPGDRMDMTRKITIAKVLDNTGKFLNEAFDSSMGTQRSAMGEWKKFCLALTTVGIPQLISFDLVTVSPMSSIYGNIAYLEYSKGTDKGASAAGDKTADIWSLGEMDSNYTGQAVVETQAYDDLDSTHKIATLIWTPVNSADDVVKVQKKSAAGVWSELVKGTDYTVDVTDINAPTVTLTTALVTDEAIKVAYKYDNVVIPAAKLPTLKAELKNIPLEARARRIAIYYSQIAAFQAKNDYGYDLADGLAEQAVAQIAYETDTEVVEMLYEGAVASEAATPTGITAFSKTQPVGVSLADHYAAFAAKVEEYKMALYDRTKKFAPDYMVVASNIMPVLSFVPGFQAASISGINGPYQAGVFNGMKVFVSPALPAGKFFFGVNQGALQASAGVYAPLDDYALVA